MTSYRFAFGPVVATHFTNRTAIETLKGRTKSLTEFIGGCGAGRLYCSMEPNGDIEPCVFIPIKVGNIREQSLVDIWRNSPVLKQIRNRDLFKGCGECEYKHLRWMQSKSLRLLQRPARSRPWLQHKPEILGGGE
ncbi:MAG: SPASM domain-containing protein [Thermoproteota archaeon]